MKTYSRVYAKIDLDAIAYNMEQMKQNIRPETKVMAVIKADGYGHGAVQIAEMMERWELHMGLCGSDFRRGSCASHRRDSKTDSGAWMCVPRSVHGDVKA